MDASQYKMKVGIDNYTLHPLNLNPMQTLEWAAANDADGVAFSGLTLNQYSQLDTVLLQNLMTYAADHNLYLEWGGGRHIPYDMTNWTEKDIFKNNLQRAREAARLKTRIIRSCSGGLMRWQADTPATQALMDKTAEALVSQKSMLEDHHVVLALETHFEFTSFELLRIFEMTGAEPGGPFGICLDTMNLLVMLEEPVAATERLLPWVVSTHIKDGGICEDKQGLHPFPCEIGKGVIDLEKILALLKDLPCRVDLSVEDHGGQFDLPIHDKRFMAEFPDLKTEEMTSLHRLADLTRNKLKDKSITIVDRDKWPKICESRSQRDLKSLKELTGCSSRRHCLKQERHS